MTHIESIDELISAAEVAKIWNKRAQDAGFEGNYTRWSVYQRRESLGGKKTSLGYLYSRKKVWEIHLRFGSPKRPEVAERNRSRRKPHEFS